MVLHSPGRRRFGGGLKALAATAVAALALTACGGDDGDTGEAGGDDTYTFVFANGSQVGTPHEAVQN